MFYLRKNFLLLLTIVFIIITFLFPDTVVFIFDSVIIFFWYLRFTIIDALKKIKAERRASSTYVFISEPIEISLRVKNGSKFPFFLLKIVDMSNKEGALFISENMNITTSLKPKEEIVLKYKIEFRKRGIYYLKNVYFLSQDPFGIIEETIIKEIPLKIIVYPKRIPILSLPLSVRELLPTLRTNYKLLEDLNHIDGVREYIPSDSVRRIHWKASAHTGKLLVKKYEYTATTKIHLFVDLNLSDEIFAKKVWSSIRVRYEEYAIMASASFVEYLLKAKIPVKLYIIGDREKPYIVENLNYADLMEKLAGISGTDTPIYTIETALESSLDSFTFSSTVILFSMYLTKSVLPLLVKIKTRVSRLVVFIMPFGFRMPRDRRFNRPYDVFPQDIRELEKASRLLRDEGIIVDLIDPQDSLNEVLQK